MCERVRCAKCGAPLLKDVAFEVKKFNGGPEPIYRYFCSENEASEWYLEMLRRLEC